nr:peptidylprolyl isomerase [uncultured Flavobacterium sp.]
MKNIFLILITLTSLISCNHKKFDKAWATKQAPNLYVARLQTTKGNIDIEVERKLSPNAADRFYQLVKHDFFVNGTFYRVVPGFVAQFSNTDTLIANPWKTVKVLDEPVIAGNNKGFLSFARLGKNSRDIDLFINLNNNNRLDTVSFEGVTGFPSFGKVIAGWNVVENLYGDYGEQTMSDEAAFNDIKLLRSKYPKLERIIGATIIKEE